MFEPLSMLNGTSLDEAMLTDFVPAASALVASLDMPPLGLLYIAANLFTVGKIISEI